MTCLGLNAGCQAFVNGPLYPKVAHNPWKALGKLQRAQTRPITVGNIPKLALIQDLKLSSFAPWPVSSTLLRLRVFSPGPAEQSPSL